MGRRNEHSQEELVDLVISTTTELLEHSSASDLSLRKIAKEVGYAPSTLVHVFNNYNNLLLQVNACTLDEMYQAAVTTQTDAKSADENLKALAFAYVDYAKSFPYRWQLVFDHSMAEGEDVPKEHQQRIDRLFNTIETQLIRIKPEGSQANIELTARIIWASIHGVTQLAVNDKLFVAQTVDSTVMLESLLTNYLTGWRNK